MKKKPLFKLLILFLTLVVFSCCFGCTPSELAEFVEQDLEKMHREFIERALAKKAEADSFIPQVDDYVLELKPNNYFESVEAAFEEGFYISYSKKFKYAISLWRYPKEEKYIFFIEEPSNSSQNYKYKFEYDFSEICGSECFFNTNSKNFLSYLLEYDGKLFAISKTELCSWVDESRHIIPPALYMIDVENEQVLYCGYFEEWFDEVFLNYEGKGSYDYYYRITKKVS